MFTKPTTVQPNPAILSTELEGEETVLLHLGTQNYYSLNATATYIWTLVNKGHDVAQISQALAAKYEVTVGDAQRYVTQLVTELTAEQLLHVETKA